MKFETSNLYIKFSSNLQNQSLWEHIIRLFKDSNITHSNDLRQKEVEFSSGGSNPLINLENSTSEAVIPFCIISPKFNYKPHISRIREINKTQHEIERESERIKYIVILFVTFEIYDKVINSNIQVDTNFGHKVIDILFHEIQKYYLIDCTRCIVIWIGTRDFLSQESLFFLENIKFPSIIDDRKSQEISKKNFIDQSSLDKCIISLLINNSIDSIETKNELEASQYLNHIISAISDVQKKSMSSKYKPRISSFSSDSLWISQLLQIPGLSEDSARAIENVYRTPSELINYIEKHSFNSNDKLEPSKSGFKTKFDDSDNFSKLSNISFLCSKGLNSRKIGKARTKKLVLLYNRISSSKDILSDPIL
ncbi:hypothetical protein FG386_000444 [Cryptosporidium ryanae]|uniref:uncharacterized protein n=1 Tax=Cryptosporidium ryanae TaxID=515981 RepID=UPI00351A06AD|nr:hypothetical protein FG386_000444 [Cryptosporidium ryanae]